ncbi:MAG: hypothetical protein JJU33_00860, partial [Phycisphaerales bacterium]|nr:hypothetical protein [Phycisphaerales bacterium]
ILANGGNGSTPSWAGGGGSGGSLWIDCGTLSGAGSIRADGGNGAAWSGGPKGGGGGGGRIAIYTCDQQLPLSNFLANGGSGFQAGQPGTIFFGSGSIRITEQPVDVSLLPGESFSLQVEAVTDQPNQQLSYQWRKQDAAGEFVPLIDGQGGGRYSGVNTPMLTVIDAVCSDGSIYDCLVMDDCGSFPSIPVTVYVEIFADLNKDGIIDADDFFLFLQFFADGDPRADINGDGIIDADDFFDYLVLFAEGCP